MLLYLDAALVRYCADYEGFLFGDGGNRPVPEAVLRRELMALRNLIQREGYGPREVATSPLLLQELCRA